MRRDYYSDSISNFINTSPDEILGKLVRNSEFSVEQPQRDWWLEEITILKNTLSDIGGAIYFEYSIPRMGKRSEEVGIFEDRYTSTKLRRSSLVFNSNSRS